MIQKYNESKRLLSLLLTVVMCLMMLPTTAFAADTPVVGDTFEETEPSTEVTELSTESAPVCDCGTDGVAIHATTCAVYVAPENPVCYCTEKCSDTNIWCDVCGFDISKCSGEDTATAYDAITSGTCGDSLTWEITLNKDGTTHTLTISGSGAMADYEVDIMGFSNSPWSTYNVSITNISLPEGLTSIGTYAFYDCNSLSELVIPGSVTAIGNGAIAPKTNVTVHYLGVEGSVTLGTSAVCDISLFHYCEEEAAIEATCVASGHEAGWYCIDCQKYITGEETAIDPDNHNIVNGTCNACGETQSVISVNITWGAMSFTYTDGEWQPESHTYADGKWTPNNENGNVITVQNNGNVAVKVTFAYNKTVTEVAGSFTDESGNAITSPFALAVEEEKKIKLILNGEPSSTFENKELGTVTVAITLPEG